MISDEGQAGGLGGFEDGCILCDEVIRLQGFPERAGSLKLDAAGRQGKFERIQSAFAAIGDGKEMTSHPGNCSRMAFCMVSQIWMELMEPLKESGMRMHFFMVPPADIR